MKKLRLQSPIKFQDTELEPNVPAVTARRRPSLAEIGAPGQLITGGRLLTTDYNIDLQPPAIYDAYDRMRKGDGQVSALLNAIKLPLLNVDWRMQPASEDEADIAIARWAETALDNMTTSFDSVMYQILLYLDYGSMPLEEVWALDADNLIIPRKLAPRHPKTIAYWNVDENGGLKSITQYAYKSSGFQEVTIPIDKLLVFVNNQEGSDWRGNSILRSAYKHWFYKDRMYIIDAIAKERRAIGVDVGTLKGNDITKQDEDDLQYALMGLHAHEKQFMIEQDERFTYRIEGLEGRPLATLDSIEHHDKLILRSLLAEFIALGSAEGGSYALSRDKSSFFTMSLNSIVKHIADIFNRHFIPKWLGYNWALDKYPKLIYSRIDTRDMNTLSLAITRLQQSGFLHPTSEDENNIRDSLELPSLQQIGEDVGIPLSAAHLQAMVQLFTQVGMGLITRESANAILRATYPNLPETLIDEITTQQDIIPPMPENEPRIPPEPEI